MILSAKLILEMSRQHPFISNLCERELEPEGVGFDVRVGRIHRLSGEGFLGVIERRTPDIKEVGQGGVFVLRPGEYVLATTLEEVDLPGERVNIPGIDSKHLIMLDVYPRTTLQRSGVLLRTTKTDPGYHGALTFGMYNAGNAPFKLEIGARIANAVFKAVHGELAREYTGQWKGGRIAALKQEKQT
jgi:deoxycytidine triphosphate deaminase